MALNLAQTRKFGSAGIIGRTYDMANLMLCTLNSNRAKAAKGNGIFS